MKGQTMHFWHWRFRHRAGRCLLGSRLRSSAAFGRRLSLPDTLSAEVPLQDGWQPLPKGRNLPPAWRQSTKA